MYFAYGFFTLSFLILEEGAARIHPEYYFAGLTVNELTNSTKPIVSTISIQHGSLSLTLGDDFRDSL